MQQWISWKNNTVTLTMFLHRWIKNKAYQSLNTVFCTNIFFIPLTPNEHTFVLHIKIVKEKAMWLSFPLLVDNNTTLSFQRYTPIVNVL